MFGAFKKFGKLGAIGKAIAAAWSPSALWPTGTEPGMWISPRTLTSEWQDYTGTTPVATPGTVADASNPVGLARDLRSGNPPPLGPELVVDGDFSDGASWNKQGNWTVSGGSAHSGNPSSGLIYRNPTIPFIEGALYAVTVESSGGQAWVSAGGRYHILTFPPGTNTKYVTGWGGSPYPWVGIEAENDVSVANISVREVPGHHMLQATSAARPLESARVNLLAYTEDFGNAVWVKRGAVTVTANQTTAPDGTNTADAISDLGGDSTGDIYQAVTPLVVGTDYTLSFYIKRISTVGTINLKFSGAPLVSVDLSTIGSDWVRVSATATGVAITDYFQIYGYDGAPVSVYLWGAQVDIGATLSDYQSVPGDGSTYDATGITPFQLYDGTDDGMATASFSAGALINGMDCLIAVRWDSAAQVIAGLYETAGSGTRYTGYAESGASGPCFAGAGTPTVWVDDVQLSGGTSVTAGTLAAALTVGEWHILEFRNLNLSAWTAAEFGSYTGFYFNGARGDIMLYPSTASTEDKDAARQYLADYYGVRLP